jgi:hypothetical protein
MRRSVRPNAIELTRGAPHIRRRRVQFVLGRAFDLHRGTGDLAQRLRRFNVTSSSRFGFKTTSALDEIDAHNQQQYP